ncbi:glycosyltransferase [Niabella hibiscisoli]|uniref:glycosyltransferase n=1 Tax=Niabella hibiscisoli TaxID=1825928 RepID=UPI001F0D3D9B|nr:glycosyltransferase [Niabella hibiscisoli]MCH5716819.1 glycosyltransferase [Niabella hibiscisoli]
MATCNGEAFVAEQISSILQQLTWEDELIISDDDSTDDTVSVIQSFDDPRIRFYRVRFNSLVKNFEFVLSKSEGSYIFCRTRMIYGLIIKYRSPCIIFKISTWLPAMPW